MPAPRFVGAYVKRVEDPRLIQGRARYLDDVVLPGLLHLVFVRSPHAHARITKVDVSAARAEHGLAAVLTAADLGHLGPKPIMFQPPGREEVVYDQSGQCLTGTLMDYVVPKADDLPSFELDRTVTPTSVNPLGAKGVGEAGAVGAPVAVVNAVLDALAPFDVGELAMPLRPEQIWAAVRGRRQP